MTLSSNDPRHGTTNGYKNLDCRCDRCRKAGHDDHAARATIMRLALLFVRCPMCRLGIFPGHGHQRRNGAVTRQSRLTWV